MLKLLLDGDYYNELSLYESDLKAFLTETIEKKIPMFPFGNNTKFFKLLKRFKNGQDLDLKELRYRDNFRKNKNKSPIMIEANESEPEEYEEESFEVRPQLVSLVNQIQLYMNRGNKAGAIQILNQIPPHFPEYKIIYNKILSY